MAAKRDGITTSICPGTPVHRCVAKMGGKVIVVGLLSCLCALAWARWQDESLSLRIGPNPPGEGKKKRPNFLFILTDDQDAHMGGDWRMPNLHRLISDQGINFTSYTANYAVCCPSRTTILTGECAHNHGVVGAGDVPLGGFGRFINRKLEEKTGPYLLQKAGYRTGLIGKYLNVYVNTSYIPQGWERWFAFTVGDIDYYNFTVSDQGKAVYYDDREENYSTDVLKQKALEFIREAKSDDRPFFLYLTPYATHHPHVPAKRHRGVFKGIQIPRVPSWNASDEFTAKKASFLKTVPPIDVATARALDFEYENRAETLLAVDELIEAIVQALEEIGELDNTYVSYVPDNGFKLGHHRVFGKISPYEYDVRLPFAIRGPGVPKGLKLNHLVGNIDFVPTWLELAGVEDPLATTRDGISLVPILRGDKEILEDHRRHRVAILIEKPATTGVEDNFTSILTPLAHPQDDPFEGVRPQLLPNGSWPWHVLEWEFLGGFPGYSGRDFNERLAERVKQGVETGNVGFPVFNINGTLMGVSLAGYKIYGELAKERGLDLAAVVRAGSEEFPAAYYAIKVLTKKGLWKLIEFANGFELYDLKNDPFEANNIFSTAPRELVAALQGALGQLKVCRGANCRVHSINLLTHPHPFQEIQLEP